MVSRECVYYINLRQAYLLSPHYANRLSSRTVLFGCVPRQYLDEAKLRKVFGDSVKNVWVSRDSDELDHLVKEREQTALRLENAEIVLIKKANEARKLAIKNGHPDMANVGRDLAVPSRDADDPAAEANLDADLIVQSRDAGKPDIEDNIETDPAGQPSEGDANPNPESVGSQGDSGSDGAPPPKTYPYTPPPDINGSVAAQWLPHESRPRHRPLANYGRRVDTIKWTRLRLKQLAPKINKLRKQLRAGKGKPIPAVFIEFDSQVNAQSAYQALSHHRAMHMSPRFIGVRPQEVVWSSLRMVWWERIIRRFLIQAFIAVMVLFWSLPCGLVGIISNVNSLSSEVPFLGWIEDLPGPILGLISGLLPAVALSTLMSLVPAVMRSKAESLFVLHDTNMSLRLC
jgi:calcium permeable stress-gated cation channel